MMSQDDERDRDQDNDDGDDDGDNDDVELSSVPPNVGYMKGYEKYSYEEEQRRRHFKTVFLWMMLML